MKQTMSHCRRMLIRLVASVLLMMLLVLPASAADWEGALEELVAGMNQEAVEIDLSQYKIPVEMLKEKYFESADLGYFPWYVDDINTVSAYYYTYYTNTGFIATVEPTYLDRNKYNRNVYEAKVREILEKCIDEEMSQWQMALSLHDYIVTHCEYDYRFYENRNSANYYGYDCLVNNLAVCEGYARAYLDLLKRVGIPAARVLSRSMDHTWNLIQLNGKWYHVDATWDDPGFNEKDIEGYCGHDYFLISDAGMMDPSRDHKGWVKYYDCTDTLFESGTFWNGNESSIVLPDTQYSFLSRSDYEYTNLYIRDSYTAQEELIFRSENPGGANGWLYSSYGVSYDNGYVYCCDNQNVYAVSPDGESAYKVYTNKDTSCVIVGCYVENGVLELTTQSFSDQYKTTKVNIGLPNNHRHKYVETLVDPSCRYQGYSRYACSCGSVFAAGYLDATGEHIPQGGYEITIEPGFGVTGERWFTCGECDALIAEELPDLNTLSGEFGDVNGSAYYYEPVLWAFSRGVTTGTEPGVFSPDNTCTRAQVVTFLWRAMGEPEPVSDENPFTDVKPGLYYYKAVLWAVENGITNGMTLTTFEPEGSCTRAQVVTLLNRTAGNPVAASGSCAFTDVKAGDYYYQAMLWAVEEEITNGMTPDTFEPNRSCTRGQIVTFLHRYLTN